MGQRQGSRTLQSEKRPFRRKITRESSSVGNASDIHGMETNKRKRDDSIDGYIPHHRPSFESTQNSPSLTQMFQTKKKLSVFGTTIILQLGRKSEHVDDINLEDVVHESIDLASSHNPSIKSLIDGIQTSKSISNNNSNVSEVEDESMLQLTADSNTRFVEFMLFVLNVIEQLSVYTVTPQHASRMQPSVDNAEKPSKKEKYKFKPSNPSTMFEKHWRDHFQELSHFKNLNGHCNVSRTTKGFEQLGNWLADQRRKLRRGKLTKEQYQMLTDLGVEWDRSYYFVARAVV